MEESPRPLTPHLRHAEKSQSFLINCSRETQLTALDVSHFFFHQLPQKSSPRERTSLHVGRSRMVCSNCATYDPRTSQMGGYAFTSPESQRYFSAPTYFSCKPHARVRVRVLGLKSAHKTKTKIGPARGQKDRKW